MVPTATVTQSVHADLSVTDVAVRSLQFGIASWFLLFLMWASFGPWFRLDLAYVLAGSSMVLGAAGISRAHAAGSPLRQTKNPSYIVGGILLSSSAIFVSLAYTGLLSFFLLPYLALFAIPFAAIALSMRWRTTVCSRCGQSTRSPVISGSGGVICSGCTAMLPWG